MLIVSSYTIVLTFTVQRFLIVCYPFRFDKTLVQRRTKHFLLAFNIVNLVIFLPVFYIYALVKTNTNSYSCRIKEHLRNLIAWFALLATLFAFITPFIGFLAINCIIAHRLKHSSRYFTRRKSKQILQQEEEHLDVKLNLEVDGDNHAARMKGSGGNSIRRHLGNQTMSDNSAKIANMLLLDSFIFFVLNFFFHLFSVYVHVRNRIAGEPGISSYDGAGWMISKDLYFTSLSCNVLLYSIYNGAFRAELKRLFCIRCIKK